MNWNRQEEAPLNERINYVFSGAVTSTQFVHPGSGMCLSYTQRKGSVRMQ